jgi:hypothetical protein
MIEIVFDWGERMAPACLVSGILLGRSMESGAEWKVFLRVCDPGENGEGWSAALAGLARRERRKDFWPGI